MVERFLYGDVFRSVRHRSDVRPSVAVLRWCQHCQRTPSLSGIIALLSASRHSFNNAILLLSILVDHLTNTLSVQIYSTNLNKPEDCSKTFKSNRNLGILLWIAIIMSSAIKYKERQDKDSAPS